MMRSAELYAVTESIRKSNGVVAAIAHLETLLASNPEPDDRIEIYQALKAQYLHAKRVDAYETLLVRCADEFPSDVVSQIALAQHYCSSDEMPDAALGIAKRAVALAKQRHQLVRHALQTAARVAKRARRFDLFEELVEEILRNEYPTIRADISYEADVVADLPKGAVNAALVRRFLQHCGGGRGA